MTRYEFKSLNKEINKIADLLADNEMTVAERRRLVRKEGGLELLRDNEIAKGFGVVV